MASREPLGLASMSMEAAPEASTYWVAIWPLAISRSSSAWGAVKPTWDWSIQGDWTEATRVVTYRLWWRPMVLKVRVGQPSSMARISP